MESFTHESEESSSCTQSDGDSTNSSNGTNPFLLCPRGNSLQVGGHGRPHDSTEDTRPFKLARVEPPGHHRYHASAINNPQGVPTMPYPHNVIGAIHGSDGLHSSTLLSQARSYVPSALEDCRGLPPQVASAARPPHGALPYLGATQNFFTQDQWTGLRQQTYVLKHVAAGNTPSSALLLPMGCKVDKMPINFGNNSGSFYLGLADPQPGRCRRTDGKKWRCGRAVVPEQKYCERHMHRGRGRSKAAKLAKITTTVDTNQPHSSARPLNQPLIQLLSQLTVPVQPLSQPPDTVQQPSAPAQPLKWLQRSAQTFEQPHAHLPYVAQPLTAEPLSQLPIQSKPLDWSINQSPMQAEPLNLGQSNGRPPILAQAIPMSAVPEVKIGPDRTNGSVTTEASRVRTDDPNDVFNLDVQGIKRLLENAPCSMRSRSSANKQKQLPNVADLLNVAHIRNLNTQPKKPPSLMDILKMVDPGTTTSTRTTTTSICHHQSPNTTKDSRDLPANGCQPGRNLPGTGHTGTLLSLTWCDEQAAQKQNNKQYSNLSSSLGLLTAQAKEETMPLKLFKVKCEEGAFDHDKLNTTRLLRKTEGDCLQSSARDDLKGPLLISTEGCTSHPASLVCRTSETANGSQPEVPCLVNESQTCSANPINLEKTCLKLMEERNQSAGELKKDAFSLADGDSKSVEGSNCQKISATFDINSSTQAEGGFDDHVSLIEQERRSPSLRKEVLNNPGTSPKSDSVSLIFLEGSLDSCDSSGKSEGFLPSLVEKSLDQGGCSESPDMSSLISMKKMVEQHQSCTDLDMNSPILVIEDECQLGNSELGKTSISSTLPIEILQAKVALDRSSSDSSCNVSSFSKSTLSLDPAALSNPETSCHVSLAN